MKKIIIAIIALCSIKNEMKAQDNYNGIATGTIISGTALTTTYFLICNSEHKYNLAHNDGVETKSERAKIYKDNCPFIITGAACFLIAGLALAEEHHITLNKRKTVSLITSEAGVGIAYNFQK